MIFERPDVSIRVMIALGGPRADHSPKARLAVMTTLVRSQNLLIRWNSSWSPERANGRSKLVETTSECPSLGLTCR